MDEGEDAEDMLAQAEGDEHETALVQLAKMLNDLEDDEFAQVTEKMESDIVDLAQNENLSESDSGTDAEGEGSGEGQSESEGVADSDAEAGGEGESEGESGADSEGEQELVQIGADDEPAYFDDVADFFMQTDDHTKDSLGEVLVQTNALANDFLANMQPETREMFEQMYAQTREAAYNWFSQAEESTQAMASHMLAQTSYGNYFTQTCVRPEVADEVTNFFSQFDAEPINEDAMLAQLETQVMDAELEEAAAYLAQLDDD